MSATLKMKKWRDNFLQIPEGLRGHPMSELEEVASTLTAIVNMTDDSHIQDMAKFCITEVIAADKEIATRDAELARLRELILHIWVHDGYENCGYMKMTTEQKQLYDEITNLDDS